MCNHVVRSAGRRDIDKHVEENARLEELDMRTHHLPHASRRYEEASQERG